ncbi:hypothetical protein I4U23_018573 [Adineta vaga]|nr:hypothetical protein I4U23_018573 [Adineta vaga]
MDSTAVAWEKHSASQIQFLPNRQYFQSNANKKSNTTKKVHFDCPPSNSDQQAFEGFGQLHSESMTSKDLSFNNDNAYLSPSSSSSTNILNEKCSTIHVEPLCSIRALIITFIIISLIIIAVGITLGVVFGTINSSSKVTEATSGNFKLNASLTTSSTSLTSIVIIGNQSGPPCLSYTSIDDPTRNVAYNGSFFDCDNGPIFNASNGGTWIRFMGRSGDILAQTPPGRRRCSAYLSIWFNSTLPTILGTTVNGTGCIDSDVGQCLIQTTIEVIYCVGGFYIYFLKPVHFCSTRYCTTFTAPIG